MLPHPSRKKRALDGAQSIVGETEVKTLTGPPANDYFGARYMASSMGRFLSPDWSEVPDSIPYADMENPQSFNLYSYVRNNPLSSADPDGHDCVVQSRTSNTTETVTTTSGNCDNVNVGDGQTKTYVPGTVTGISVNGGNSIDIGYNSYDGQSSGVTNAGGAPTPDNPGLAYNWGNNAQGYATLGAASKAVNYATIGVAVTFGAVGGAIVATDAIAGYGLTTLAGEDGLGMASNQAINRMIGATQRELLKDFFKSGKLPEGLSQRTLQLYKEVAQRAIAAGKDQLGVQAQRLQMITNAMR
jgi:RHS repeat-associated protein